MANEFIEKIFDKESFAQSSLERGVYEACSFVGCEFSKSNFGEIRFLGCRFLNCNLSLVLLGNTMFREIEFKSCKMVGLHFGDCNKFGFSVSFDSCILDYSSFYQTRLKQTFFKNTRLQEVSFTECDLSRSVFDCCDFIGAVFQNTCLESTDFRTSFNYFIDPELNRLKKAKFSFPGIVGLLNKYDIEISM